MNFMYYYVFLLMRMLPCGPFTEFSTIDAGALHSSAAFSQLNFVGLEFFLNFNHSLVAFLLCIFFQVLYC